MACPKWLKALPQIRPSLTREKRNLALTTLPLIGALHHSAVPTCASRLTSYNPER